MTELFEVNKVKKFFKILDKLTGSIPVNSDNYRYKDYQTIYTKESKHIPSTREVFVNRTINKWLKGKALIIYKTSDLGIQYKQYISITHLSYKNNWSSGYIDVGIIDYCQLYNSSMFGGSLKIEHNDALNLEGEWCNDLSKHNVLIDLTSMSDVPEKEYVFKAYDFNKYPKRNKKGVDPKELMETTKSFFAKTSFGAYEAKRRFEKESDGKLLISELIAIKIKENKI